MITVSVISILILLFSVTVIIGFLWYTRRLLKSKCGCSNLQSANNNIPLGGRAESILSVNVGSSAGGRS